MATEVKRYLASDGKEFQTARDADHHDIAVTFCRSVALPTGTRNVYEAVCVALEKGWTFVAPRGVKYGN